MRKIIIILSIFILFLTNGCSTDENVNQSGLYAFTLNVNNYDEYASNELALHLLTYYGKEYEIVKDSLKLGRGIFVFGKETPTVLYPVWQDDIVTGVFNVVYYNEQFGGSYSEGNSEQLSYAIGKTHQERPLKLLKTENGFYYSIGNDVYSMTGNPGETVNDISIKIEFFKKFLLNNGKVVNVQEILEYIPITSIEFLE